MLDLNRITEVAQDVARETFGDLSIAGVHVTPISAWTGEDALDVEIVFSGAAGQQLQNGDHLSAMSLLLGDRLFEMGELRFAYVRYSTRKERGARVLSGT